MVLYGCISFDSYIKPQPAMATAYPVVSCISFDSYIKPQQSSYAWFCICVVYLLIPTSNHNLINGLIETPAVVYLLIPTSNHNNFVAELETNTLYIF